MSQGGSVVTLALTVIDAASGQAEDVLVSGDANQRVAMLAQKLAEHLGYAADETTQFSLRVQRTGEQLAPEATLAASDLLEGDVLSLSSGPPAAVLPQRPRRRPGPS